MMADIGEPGAWRRVFTQPNLAKFDQPTVSGVAFPEMGIAEARNEQATGILHIGTYAATVSQRRAPTAFRITQLPDASACKVRCDGAPYHRWRASDQQSIEIDLDVDDHQIQFSPMPTELKSTLPTVSRKNTRQRTKAQLRREVHRIAPDVTTTRDLALPAVPRPPCACC